MALETLVKPTNPIYLGDYNLEPPEEPPDTDEILQDNDDFCEPNDYNDDYFNPNAP